jgi:hypothetical protein
LEGLEERLWSSKSREAVEGLDAGGDPPDDDEAEGWPFTIAHA